jgi:hypothetical protein
MESGAAFRAAPLCFVLEQVASSFLELRAIRCLKLQGLKPLFCCDEIARVGDPRLLQSEAFCVQRGRAILLL